MEFLVNQSEKLRSSATNIQVVPIKRVLVAAFITTTATTSATVTYDRLPLDQPVIISTYSVAIIPLADGILLFVPQQS